MKNFKSYRFLIPLSLQLLLESQFKPSNEITNIAPSLKYFNSVKRKKANMVINWYALLKILLHHDAAECIATHLISLHLPCVTPAHFSYLASCEPHSFPRLLMRDRNLIEGTKRDKLNVWTERGDREMHRKRQEGGGGIRRDSEWMKDGGKWNKGSRSEEVRKEVRTNKGQRAHIYSTLPGGCQPFGSSTVEDGDQ